MGFTKMRHISNDRRRTGFAPVDQNDVDDSNSDSDERGQHPLAERERFRRTVYQIARQAPSVLSQNANPPSAHSSPALSDTTVFSHDYLSLPIQQFDEVDLTDARGTYAEPADHYGPEVVDDNHVFSNSYMIKAGKDIQVRVESYPLALSPCGLYVDDRLQDFSYGGSEGIVEKPLLADSSLYNYRPVPLRWRFLLTVLGGLVVVLALSELALRLLPDASGTEESLPAFQNISEIRKRSGLHGNAVSRKWHFAAHGNGTVVTSTTELSSTTEVTSMTEVTSITEIISTTKVGSTTKIGAQPTTSRQSSTTKKIETTTKPHNEQPPTTLNPVTKATSTQEGSSETITPIFTRTTTTKQSHHTITEATSTLDDPSETTTTILTLTTATEQSLHTTTDVTSLHDPSETTTFIRTTRTEQSYHTITEATSTLDDSSETTTSTVTRTTRTEPSLQTTTNQNTGSQTSDETSPTSHTTSNIPPSSTQTKNEMTSTEGHHIPPEPNPAQGTSTLQETTDRPSVTTTTTTPTTASSPHSTTTQQPSHPLSSGSLTPGPQTSSSPVDVDDSSSNTSTFASTPSSSSTSQVEEADNGPPAQSASKPTGANSLSSSHQSNHESEFQTKDQSTATDHQTESHDTIENTSTATRHVPSTVTTGQVFLSTDATTAMSGVKVYGSQNEVSQTKRPSTSTKLPERPEQNETVEDEPFTTITMVPDTETPLPVITSFTTSSTVEGGSYVEVTMVTTIVGHIKAADTLTEYIVTTTYRNGTVSTISENVHDRLSTYTEFDSAGNPTSTVYVHILNTAQVTTLRNPFGFPTAVLEYFDVEVTTTLYDGNVPTATRTTTVPETQSPSTLYDSNGIPTRTLVLLRPISTTSQIVPASPTPPPRVNDQQTLELRRMPNGIYFVGVMLPTLLAILVFIPVRILHQNIKLYQGFHALASDRGASAAESICMKTTGPTSLFDGLWSLRRGNYLLGLTSALVVLSALTIPFSAEVSRLILRGPQCHPYERGKSICSIVPGVVPTTARVLSALFIVLIVGIAVVALQLRRWETGVERNPWSISYMAQLAANDDMRRIFERFRRYRSANKAPGTKEFASKLRGKILGLHEWEENHVMKYSVLILTQEIDDGTEEKTSNKAGRSVKFSVDPEAIPRQRRLRWPSGDSAPFFMLSWIGRILFLVLLSGVLVAVIIYDLVARGSEYERGLTGKAVGVRFLFSGVGVLISVTWGAFFHAVAFLSPYKLLYSKRLNQGEAININPATNSFTGLRLAFVPSRRDTYLGAVAATAILSEFLPLYLGNIPCNGVQLQSMETVCSYLSVAILSAMLLTVGGSFFVDWPPTTGADPSTIAGAMYAAHVFSVEQPGIV